MSNVIAFTPCPRPPEPAAPVPLAGTDLRTHLEEAAQTALDAADKIIAALDRMDEVPASVEAAATATDPESREGFRDTYARPRARQSLSSVATDIEEAEPAPDPKPQDELRDRYRAPAHARGGENTEPLSTCGPVDPEPEPIILPEPCMPPTLLPWHGAGNVVAAAGCAFLALMVRT